MHMGSSSGSSSRGGSTASGSLWLSDIKWCDMWAIVAKHYNFDQEADKSFSSFGGHVYGKSYSCNPGLVMQYNSKTAATSSSWGAEVMLRVLVRLEINHSQNNQSKYIVCILVVVIKNLTEYYFIKCTYFYCILVV